MSDRLIGQPEPRARGHNRPQQVLAVGGHFVDDISVGSEHTLALTCDGEIWAWGSNSDGQLGLGHMVAVRDPQLVTGLGRSLIKQVSGGVEERSQSVSIVSKCTPDVGRYRSLLYYLLCF